MSWKDLFLYEQAQHKVFFFPYWEFSPFQFKEPPYTFGISKLLASPMNCLFLGLTLNKRNYGKQTRNIGDLLYIWNITRCFILNLIISHYTLTNNIAKSGSKSWNNNTNIWVSVHKYMVILLISFMIDIFIQKLSSNKTEIISFK